jgi:hypothetical protein
VYNQKYMIMQIVNIASGVVGAASLVREKITHQEVHGALDKVHPYEMRIGVVTVVFGLMALVERLGLVHFGLPLGSSFPQALPAIALGLVLGAPYFERISFLKSIIAFLAPYREWLGLIAIASGLGSLLFGCVAPLVCTMPF